LGTEIHERKLILYNYLKREYSVDTPPVLSLSQVNKPPILNSMGFNARNNFDLTLLLFRAKEVT